MRIVLSKKHTIRRSILLISVLLLGCEALMGVVTSFDNDSVIYSNSGYLKLTWDIDEDQTVASDYTYTLQQANDSNFTSANNIYSGHDRASFISGLPDGKYFFRVSVNEKDQFVWSQPIKLIVKHHSRKLALTLFIAGSIIFSATVGVIIQGNKKYKI